MTERKNEMGKKERKKEGNTMTTTNTVNPQNNSKIIFGKHPELKNRKKS